MIRRFLRASSIGVAALAIARGIVRALPIWVAGLLVLGAFDRWVELAPGGRQAVWVLFALSGLAAIVSGFKPFRLFSLLERSKNLSLRNPSLRMDDLRLAHDFTSSRHAVWPGSLASKAGAPANSLPGRREFQLN